MTRHKHIYNSYLLRVWKDSTAEGWRASLQDVANGELKCFANLVDLYQYLAQHTGGFDQPHGIAYDLADNARAA